MKKIAIIGLGLIGGSLALAFKKAGFYVIGIARREETLLEAKERGAIDQGSCKIKDVAAADFVFICTPINLIIPILTEAIPHLKEGAVVSDVGSTKQEIVSCAEKMMPKGIFFVGGHPMAGKEKVKFEEAEASLFYNKRWILTETLKSDKKATLAIEELIKVTGAQISRLSPKTHDLVVAAISHMPLAVAVARVNAVGGEVEKELMFKCAASGFFDTTRIASGDPVLGIDMFVTNKKAVLKMIKAFKASLFLLEKFIKNGDIEFIKKEIERAKIVRDKSCSLANYSK